MDSTLREYYQWVQVLAYFLQAESWPFAPRELTKQDAFSQVVICAQSLGLNPKDRAILLKIIDKIDALLVGRTEIVDTSRLDVTKIKELVRDYDQYLKTAQERKTKILFPTLDAQIKALQKQYTEEIKSQLIKTEEKFSHNPRLAETISEEIASEIASKIPPVARKLALKEADYYQALAKTQLVVSQSLKQAGIKSPQLMAKDFLDKVGKSTFLPAQEIAITSRVLVPKPPIPLRKEFAPEEVIFPEEIIKKLALEPEGVAFLSAYALLQPQVAGALGERILFTPPTLVLKIAASELTPEWQEMINKGLFVEDIEASIARLKELGLSPTHPLILALEDKRIRFLEQQKIKVIQEDGTFYYQDKPAAAILKRYYLFSKLTNRSQIYDEETKNFLPLPSPSPIWSRKEGYSWRLRQGLDNLGFFSRFFEKVEIGAGKSVIRFTLPDKIVKFFTLGHFESLATFRTAIYQKTLGKIVIPLGRKIATSAIGQGIKKAALWIASRLGVEAAITAISTAVVPIPGVGTAIGLAISKVIEFAGKVLGKVWEKLKEVIREPGKALALFLGGGLALVLLPMPIALVGVIPALLGGLGVISWGIGSAGAMVGGAASQITTFFAALAAAPITAPIALLVTTGLIVLGATTFFIVMTTAGAFILPVGPTEMIPEVPPPPAPPEIPPPPGLTFRWPVDSPFSCSSNYGYRPSPFANCCEYHEGIDIPAACGSPVYATADGTVVYTGNGGGYGLVVVIKHADKFFSFYAHLEGTSVSRNQSVKKGDLIGFVGSSGGSTGCHLHFAFSICGDVPGCFNDGRYTPDPCDYVSCPRGCGYQDRTSGCQGLPLCSGQ